MEAVLIKIYAQSQDFTKIVEILHSQGLKVIVHSRREQGEAYDEIIVYRGVELEKI